MNKRNESKILFKGYLLGIVSKEEVRKRLGFNEQDRKGATYYDPQTRISKLTGEKYKEKKK